MSARVDLHTARQHLEAAEEAKNFSNEAAAHQATLALAYAVVALVDRVDDIAATLRRTQ